MNNFYLFTTYLLFLNNYNFYSLIWGLKLLSYFQFMNIYFFGGKIILIYCFVLDNFGLTSFLLLVFKLFSVYILHYIIYTYKSVLILFFSYDHCIRFYRKSVII